MPVVSRSATQATQQTYRTCQTNRTTRQVIVPVTATLAGSDQAVVLPVIATVDADGLMDAGAGHKGVDNNVLKEIDVDQMRKDDSFV